MGPLGTYLCDNLCSPIIGGLLSRPVEQFLKVFVSMVILNSWRLIYISLHALYLPSALHWLRSWRSFSCERWVLLNWHTSIRFDDMWLSDCTHQGDSRAFSQEQIPQRYHPGPVTPTGSSDSLSTEDAARSANGDDSKALPLHSLLIPRVIIAAGNYAAVSFLDIAFRDLQLLFFATTIELAGLVRSSPNR